MSHDDLKDGEPHPAVYPALKWIKENYGLEELLMQQEAFSSCAIEGNRLGEVCAGTLRRLMNHEPVSDRYLLGLAWTLMSFKKDKEKENHAKTK